MAQRLLAGADINDRRFLARLRNEFGSKVVDAAVDFVRQRKGKFWGR